MTGSTVNQMASAVGKMGRYPFDTPALLNQRIGKIFSNSKKVIDDYLYYFLNRDEIHYKLAVNASGSANQANISPDQIKSIKITIPDLDTQIAIAEILSSLDDKIELNNQINLNLEALAESLFKQWFLDFDFPDENGLPYKSSGGELGDSELGEIPIGWNIMSFEKICHEITRGFTTKYVDKSNLINLNQKVNRGMYLDKSNFKYYPENSEIPVNKYAKKGDILINSLGQGTLGRIHFYNEDTDNVVIDQHITIIRPDENIFKSEILYCSLINTNSQERLMSMITGSTGMLMLNISKIREFKIVVPPNYLQNQLINSFVSLFESKNCNILENEFLISLRDTLLPQLISGELNISEDQILEPV